VEANADDAGALSGPRARTLTLAEKLVVGQILAGRRGDTSSLRLPRSTRQAASSRLYVRDWIRDRYLPNPPLVGWPLVSVAVTQPFVDQLPLVARVWQESTGATLLWGSHRTLFGVFFSRGRQDRERLCARLSDPRLAKNTIIVGQDLAESVVPIFFDFEAAWARVVGTAGTVSYPQSLPRFVGASGEGDAAPLSKGVTAAVSLMLTRPFVGPPRVNWSGTGVGSIIHGTDRRLLRTGLVEFRSFLNPIAIARDIVDFPNQVVFIGGELVNPSTPEGMFHELVERRAASPFLLASDGHRVLLGSLSEGPRPSRSEPASPSERALFILKKHLRSINVVDERLDGMQVLLDHRYDHLLPQ
jgi:hypothetical protein